jgi:hypothetical protein
LKFKLAQENDVTDTFYFFKKMFNLQPFCTLQPASYFRHKLYPDSSQQQLRWLEHEANPVTAVFSCTVHKNEEKRLSSSKKRKKEKSSILMRKVKHYIIG